MKPSRKPLTGRTVLIIAVSAFGVIIAANLALLFAATGSFPGLVVKNSYVASQQFDARKAAQDALGWTGDASYADGEIALRLTGPDGQPARPDTLAAVVGRPTTDRDDLVLDLAFQDRRWVADAALEPGKWRLDVTATAPDGTAFAQTLVIRVKEP